MFGAFSFTKKVDIDLHKYSAYDIKFDRKITFSFGNGFGRNYVIFGVDLSSSTKIHTSEKNILIVGKGPTQRSEHRF